MAQFSRYAGHGEGEAVVEGELFAADVEGIEGVGAVGAVFEQVFFGLGEFFAGLILAEAVATIGDAGSLDGVIRYSLLKRSKNGMRRFLPAKPALMSRCFSSWRIGLPR